MKKNDFVLIILFSLLTAFVTTTLASAVITSPKNRSQKVKVIDVFKPDFPNPDTRIFNDKALDPTKDITIGNQNNDKLFKSGN